MSSCVRCVCCTVAHRGGALPQLSCLVAVCPFAIPVATFKLPRRCAALRRACCLLDQGLQPVA